MNVINTLALSILLQFAAAYLALRLIPVTGRRKAWMLISAGFFFMAVRRCASLFELISLGGSHAPVHEPLWSALVSLVTSIVILAGIALIAPLSHSIRRLVMEVKGSERKYRTLFDESGDAFHLVNTQGHITDANNAMIELFGCSKQELIGYDVRKLYLDPSAQEDILKQLEQQGYARNHDLSLLKRDGSVMNCTVTVTQRRNIDGVVQGYQGIIRDISSRKKMEGMLRESNDVLRAILSASPIGVCLVRNDTFEWVNDAMHRMLGYSKGALEGKSASILYSSAQEYQRVRRQLHFELDESGIAHSVAKCLRNDGSAVDCLLHASCLNTNDPDAGRIMAAMDITELKQTEEALRDSEERYRRFFEEDLTGVYISTVEGQILACNPAFASIFGFSSVEEALQSNMTSFYPNIQDRYDFLKVLNENKKLEYYQRELQRRDGMPVHVIENSAGKFTENGELFEIKGYLFDNTRQKNLEDQLRHSQKMEAIGRLAGGIAHDFNNLLTAIIGYADLQLMALKPEDRLRRNAEEIRKAADRAASLTSQLLAFSRKQVIEPKMLELNAIISDMEKMLRRLIGEDIDLFTTLDPELDYVKADPGQIAQVIMNLAVNARDAMPDGGRLMIETANVTLDKGYARQHLAVQPGPYVMLAVSDNGVGMDSETMTNIFEPFFTTKEKEKGTGLGLATVYGIVKQSEGHILVYSEPGKGATFKIYLPRIESDRQATRTSEELGEAPHGAETILLVEDDEMVRTIICESLRANGYTLLEAHQGDEALQVRKLHGENIHLLITDIVMPGINGRELAERLTEIQPTMKVLFISGYTDRGIVHNGILDLGKEFLQKPFRLETLAHKVRKLLDAE